MDITIVDALDKIRQLQEVTNHVQQKMLDGFASRDAENARLRAEIVALKTSAPVATQEQLEMMFNGMDIVLEDLIRTFGPVGPGGDPDK